MDVRCYGWGQENVGHVLRLLSVGTLSPWPHLMWRKQSQAGVTASIHLLVRHNREGGFVQGQMCTQPNTHVVTCKDLHTHLYKQVCETSMHTNSSTYWLRKQKDSWQSSTCVFLGRNHLVTLTSLKCLPALMSYYGREMACRTEAVSWLIRSGHDSRSLVSASAG